MNRFYLFSALTLLCILIFCDSRATGKSTPNIVPANAEIVALVDLERISSLSGISITDIVPMLCEQNADPMVNLLQTLATDKSLGVNWADGITLFKIPEHQNLIMAADLSDANALKEYLKSQADQYNSLEHYKKGAVSGCCNSDIAILCNKESLLVALDVKDKIEEFTSLLSSSDRGFYSTAAGKKLQSYNGEICVVVDDLVKFDGDNTAIKFSYNESTEGLYTLLNISTQKGITNFDMEYLALTPEAKQLLEKRNEAYTTLSGNLLKYIPQSAIAYTMMGLSGEGSVVNISGCEENQLLSTLKSIETISKSLKGDAALVVESIDKLGFTLLCQAKDMESVMALGQIFNAEWAPHGNGYKCNWNGMTLYASVSEDVCALSNCRDVTTLAPLSSHKSAEINGAQVYMNIDPQQNADTALTSMSTNGLSMGGLEIALMHNMIKSTIDNIEIKSYENRNQVEIKFLNEDMSLYKFINNK